MARLLLGDNDVEAELNKSALWAVTYGDLMSYLMILFLILFTYSITKRVEKVDESLASVEKVFSGKVDPERQKRIQQRAQESRIEQNLQAQAKAFPESMEVQATPERVQLVLKDAVLFDSGSAELKPAAEPPLAAIAAQLKGSPNDVVVEGHTDDVPIHRGKYGSNYELSMARAYSVVSFFIRQGIEPKRLSGAGYGEYRPIAPNATPEGRAKNRRIEIALLRTR